MIVDLFSWLILAFFVLVLLRNVTAVPHVVFDGLMVVVVLVMLQLMLGNL